jgi:mRNA interferase MazF
MLKTLWATVREGKIELIEPTVLPEGTKLIVTLLPDDEAEFWNDTSKVSLDACGIIQRMMFMPSYSKNNIILVRYPFSDLSSSKIRPAVVVNTPHSSQDILITPLTSKTASLLSGEFVLSEWSAAGLNVPTAVKRGLYTVHERLVVVTIGNLADLDAQQLELSLRDWLGL